MTSRAKSSQTTTDQPFQSGCALERMRVAAEIRARISRVTITEAWHAENEAKQALYVNERRAWFAAWRKEYCAKEPPTIIDPEHITIATLLL